MPLPELMKVRTMRRSRLRKLEHFYSLCDPASRVLDVGVSTNEHNEMVNLFLNTFRFEPSQYTGLTIQPVDDLVGKHPGKRFVQYAGGVFPFRDNEFDWAFSNAVIEHVGGREKQVQFVNEMMRVCRRAFFTTPNKFFPVESHTNTLFWHWSNRGFYAWCARACLHWNESNLVLLSARDLSDIMRASNAAVSELRKNRFLGWPMTFTVVCSKDKAAMLDLKKP